MLTTAMLLLRGSLFLSLHLAGNSGSFPKPLSAEEEQRYLALCAEGDLEARNVLVERNMRLVAHIIKKYYTQNVDQDDLISIGTIGLIKGISSYKPEKNVRLATYAARCIENAILSPARFQVRKMLLLTAGDISTQPISILNQTPSWPQRISASRMGKNDTAVRRFLHLNQNDVPGPIGPGTSPPPLPPGSPRPAADASAGSDRSASGAFDRRHPHGRMQPDGQAPACLLQSLDNVQ